MRNAIDVWVHGHHVGTLQDDPTGYLFTYDSDATPERLVSLTMPVRRRQYSHSRLFPIFAMHLPEGYLRALLTTQFAKITEVDDFGLLQLLSGSHVGRVQYRETLKAAPTPMTLQALMTPDSEQLFQELLDRFAVHSPISGVQPKVLAAVKDKTTWRLNPFIVKAWGPEYPHLALNEFYCMSVAKAAGIAVPEFHLSRDNALFIMKRFDLPEHALPLGFEDFGVLHGRSNEDKYKGSYEAIAKTIGRYVSQAHQAQAFLDYFRMIVVNQLVRNGDAHLKNFGLLYRDQDDVWLAPAYDIINTTSYIRHDVPALTLGGKKQWLSARRLIDFGVGTCGLSKATAHEAYDQCRNAITTTVTAIHDRLNTDSDPTTSAFLTQLATRLREANG